MKIKKYLYPILLCLFIFTVISSVYQAQQEDSLVGVLPIESKKQIQDALSCFPSGSFDSIRINYIEMDSDNMTWATRPSIVSFLRPKELRTYLVQKSIHPDMCWIYDQLSYEAQVGIIVHEMCHILEYEKLSKRTIISFGYDYQYDQAFKKNVEQSTDSLARIYAPHYWQAWKDAECNIDEFSNSEIANQYWKKQHDFYLTSEKCNSSQ